MVGDWTAVAKGVLWEFSAPNDPNDILIWFAGVIREIPQDLSDVKKTLSGEVLGNIRGEVKKTSKGAAEFLRQALVCYYVLDKVKGITPQEIEVIALQNRLVFLRHRIENMQLSYPGERVMKQNMENWKLTIQNVSNQLGGL